MKPHNKTAPKTLELNATADRYVATEARNRFRAERFAEDVLRVVGALAIIVGYFHWFIPDLLGTPEFPVSLRMVLTVVFVGTGLGLYVFAARGSQRMIHIDLGARRIFVGRLNRKNRSMFQQRFEFDEIESYFILRSQFGDQASLGIRIRGRRAPVMGLTGSKAELEELHGTISDIVRLATECAPKRVKRRGLHKKSAPARRPARTIVSKPRPKMNAAVWAEFSPSP